MSDIVDLPPALPAVGQSGEYVTSDGTKTKVLRTSVDTLLQIDDQGDQYTVMVKHIDPAGPQILPPKTTATPLTTQSLTVNLKDNPYFAVSFAAVFAMAMMEVENISRQTSYLESQVNLQNYNKVLALATDIKAATLLSFDLQAQEKMLQAVSSFVSATVSGITALRTIGGPGVARKQAEQDYKKQFDQQAGELEKLKVGSRGGGRIVTEDGRDVFKKITTPEEQAKLDSEIKNKEESLNKLKDNKENIIREREGIFLNRYEQEIRHIGDFTGKITDGIFKTLEASIIKQRALPEALKAYWEQLSSLLRTFSDNTIKYRDSSNDAFNKALDLFTKIIDSNFKAFSMKG